MSAAYVNDTIGSRPPVWSSTLNLTAMLFPFNSDRVDWHISGGILRRSRTGRPPRTDVAGRSRPIPDRPPEQVPQEQGRPEGGAHGPERLGTLAHGRPNGRPFRAACTPRSNPTSPRRWCR
jgi:hypothetical protein